MHLQTMTAVLGLTASGRAFAAQQSFHGTWAAVFDSGKVPQTYRLVIDATGGTLNVSSLDQGDASFATSEVVIDGERITLNFERINVKIEGVLSDARHVDASFVMPGASVEVRFTRGDLADTISERTWPPLTRSLLETKRLAAEAPAMGAAWARGDRSSLLVAGVRSSNANNAVQPQDQWHWGSITKSMTATLCARLVEAGVLSWDTTIGQVLDDDGARVPQVYRDATLVQLLCHRAGLQSNIDEADSKAFSLHLRDARGERLKYARLALAQKPVAAIGAQHAYSNNGYVVAGAMLERLTGKPWETLIRREVFAPLGLTRAGQGAPGSPGRIDQPVGHLVTDGHRAPHPPGGPDDDNVVAMGPAGRVHMPLADMLTYLTAHRDRPARFLKPATWDKLHTPPFGGNYALGWFTSRDGRLLHGGSNTLWKAEVLVDPKAGFVCVSCANDATDVTSKAVEEVLLSARASALT
jgi:CubicO group peptidase (beta-lactamase class C family)